MVAKANARGKNEPPPVIVKKITIVAGGHHGGAWKVAYADFVTAMMAFFLLLWLLGATTEKQRDWDREKGRLMRHKVSSGPKN